MVGNSGELWLPADFPSDDFFVENEDGHVGGLTQQMARSLVLQDFGSFNSRFSKATSPLSTLCGAGSWAVSSNGGSPEGPFLPNRGDALDLLYAAAGRVARLSLNGGSFQGRRLVDPAPKAHKMGALQQLQAARFYELRRQQLMRQYYARLRSRNGNGNEMGPLGPATSALPPPFQKQHRHLQAQTAFLSGGRRESKGTGVFLPRRAETLTEPKKKPVLPPARYDSRRVSGGYLFNQDVMPAERKRGPLCAQPAGSAGQAHEVRLPAEWAY